MTELSRLRSDIERVTLEIVDLVGKRIELVREVAKEKARTGSTLVNRGVEEHLRREVIKRANEKQIDSKFAVRLLNQLIIDSIRTQQTLIKPVEVPTAYTTLLKARRLEQEGRDIIHLEVGEPDFGPPDPVVKAMDAAVRQGQTCYTQSAGIHELREKLAFRLNQLYGTEITPENIMVTVGGRFALTLGIASRVGLGDEVIIIDPSYPAYADCVRSAGGRPVHITSRIEDDWNPDLGDLENSVNQSTQIIILNNPCNPTGKSFSKPTLEKIVELAIENDLQIVSDEVYSNYVYSSKTSILEFPHCSPIFVDSFSKTYGMTGFRLGYAVSDIDTIRRMTNLQNLYLTCVPEFIQVAGVSAIDCEAEANQYAEWIDKRMKVMCRELEKAPVTFYKPDGGFYIFPRIDTEDVSAIALADKLLSEKGVAIVPGDAYGSGFSGFFRISVCQPEDRLLEAAMRMKEVLG